MTNQPSDNDREPKTSGPQARRLVGYRITQARRLDRGQRQAPQRSDRMGGDQEQVEPLVTIAIAIGASWWRPFGLHAEHA